VTNAQDSRTNRNILALIVLVIVFYLLGSLNTHAKIRVKLDRSENVVRPVAQRGISDSRVQDFEADLREKTGLQGIKFSENGILNYDKTEEPVMGSRKMREVILGAINDQMNIFEIRDISGAKEIQFAATDIGTIEVNSRITTYQVMFDFADFENTRKYTADEVLDSFSLGINLLHEIDHKVSYDPNNPIPKTGVRPDKSKNGLRGVIENTNVVRKELSLVLRRSNQHNGRRYKGKNHILDRTYQITFVNKRGKRKSYLRWKLESDRRQADA